MHSLSGFGQAAGAYLVGVDGGGSGTRAVLCDGAGNVLGRGAAGPSALGQGIAPAWLAVQAACRAAFAAAGLEFPALAQIALGCGLSGVHNQSWADAFARSNPGFARLALATDAYTTLLGAHGGAPGVVIALGTGSVGEALLADGRRIEAGGWGFPSGDEASGAWIGLQAINHLQKVQDGRSPRSSLARALLAHCGGTRAAVFDWLAQANQTRYAELAPLVLEHAATAPAALILQQAGAEVAALAHALDAGASLPLALCGGLAEALRPYLPPGLRERAGRPQADAAAGALILLTGRCGSGT